MQVQRLSTSTSFVPEMLERAPDSVLVLSNLAAVCIELKAYSQALKYAQDGLKIDTNHIKCLYRCGVAHMRLGQFKDAVVLFNKAKQQVPHLLLSVVSLTC